MVGVQGLTCGAEAQAPCLWCHMLSGCNWHSTFPRCRGKHHSKFFLLQYATGLRFILLTANLHRPDCCNKSQVRSASGVAHCAANQPAEQPEWGKRCGVSPACHSFAKGSPRGHAALLAAGFLLPGLSPQGDEHHKASTESASLASTSVPAASLPLQSDRAALQP